ncbi:uncharacterized protein LOC127241407 [Andrographis paniculata]|uniref:uncharacterized protein LOC127241407 n=1 Tax=Andrographis paniculata TaxID=175694 RepID=UPI0021E73C1F|nr:uncharacterized protein LOC127241407 [Andrographis paniculata]
MSSSSSSSDDDVDTSTPPPPPRDKLIIGNMTAERRRRQRQADAAASVAAAFAYEAQPLQAVMSDQTREQLLFEVENQEPNSYSDDEPLMEPDPAPEVANGKSIKPKISVATIPEFSEVAAATPAHLLGVLVRLVAPSKSEYSNELKRLATDVVVVLDIGWCEDESMLDFIKGALLIIIDNMSSRDRLSIVSPCPEPRRLTHLRTMDEYGKESLRKIVSSLFFLAEVGDVLDILVKGVRVIDERHFENPATSIILLSNRKSLIEPENPKKKAKETASRFYKLPESIAPRTRGINEFKTIPVHTFGIGPCHDAQVLSLLSSSSLGTYSFVESYEYLPDAVASCIGGILSVVVRDIHLSFALTHGKIIWTETGQYSRAISEMGSLCDVIIGAMYANEVKEFRFEISLPRLKLKGQSSDKMSSTLRVTLLYCDCIGESHEDSSTKEILRPINPSPEGCTPSKAVTENKIYRSGAFAISNAKRKADLNKFDKARQILISCMVDMSASLRSGDPRTLWIYGEITEIAKWFGSRDLYEKFGNAYATSFLCSNAYQRGTTRGRYVPGDDEGLDFQAYTTPDMVDLVNEVRSERHRNGGKPGKN